MISVGSRGDSHDNALVETAIGPLETELVHARVSAVSTTSNGLVRP